MKPGWISLILLIVIYFLLATMENVSASEGIISGHVYDADTKQPLSQAWVYCQEVKSQKAITGIQGHYAINGDFLPSEIYTIKCLKHDYVLESKNVTTNQQGDAEEDFFIKNVNPKTATQSQPQNGEENSTGDQVPAKPAMCMAGSWTFELTDIHTRQLTLTLFQQGSTVIGTGILVNGVNDSLDVAASGTAEDNKLNLDITSLKKVTHYLLVLSINGDSASGDYGAFSVSGGNWNGSIHGVRSIPQG